jgi:hypothetical protein
MNTPFQARYHADRTLSLGTPPLRLKLTSDTGFRAEEHMIDSHRRLLILILLLAFAAPAFAQDKCTVKAVLAGTPVTMRYCVVALYDSENSVTLYFSDRPFSAREIETFHESSNPADRDAAGRPRTMMHFAFCPGGGKTVIDAAGVKSVDMSVNLANSLFLGWENTFELPKDKGIVRIERLSGDLKVGGTIDGRITGGKISDGQKYSWEADFDMRLPVKSAMAGPGCGN